MSHFQILYTKNSLNSVEEAPLHNEAIKLFNKIESTSEKTAIEVIHASILKDNIIINKYERTEEIAIENGEDDVILIDSDNEDFE